MCRLNQIWTVEAIINHNRISGPAQGTISQSHDRELNYYRNKKLPISRRMLLHKYCWSPIPHLDKRTKLSFLSAMACSPSKISPQLHKLEANAKFCETSIKMQIVLAKHSVIIPTRTHNNLHRNIAMFYGIFSGIIAVVAVQLWM